MTAYDEWIGQSSARHAPEVDFGTTWTTAQRPDVNWRLSWNTGSHELIAVTRPGDEVERLGWYPSIEEAARVVSDWVQLASQPGGLDTMRSHIRDWNDAEADFRQDAADYAQELKWEELGPPHWQEYLDDVDRRVLIDGESYREKVIDLDYDEWDRASEHPRWSEYRDAAHDLPDHVPQAPPFDEWLASAATGAPTMEDLVAHGPRTFVDPAPAPQDDPGTEAGERPPHAEPPAPASLEHRVLDRWLESTDGPLPAREQASMRMWADRSARTSDPEHYRLHVDERAANEATPPQQPANDRWYRRSHNGRGLS